jgi:hypothetical protein
LAEAASQRLDELWANNHEDDQSGRTAEPHMHTESDSAPAPFAVVVDDSEAQQQQPSADQVTTTTTPHQQSVHGCMIELIGLEVLVLVRRRNKCHHLVVPTNRSSSCADVQTQPCYLFYVSFRIQFSAALAEQNLRLFDPYSAEWCSHRRSCIEVQTAVFKYELS